jgi:hypothetical protein
VDGRNESGGSTLILTYPSSELVSTLLGGTGDGACVAEVDGHRQAIDNSGGGGGRAIGHHVPNGVEGESRNGGEARRSINNESTQAQLQWTAISFAARAGGVTRGEDMDAS